MTNKKKLAAGVMSLLGLTILAFLVSLSHYVDGTPWCEAIVIITVSLIVCAAFSMTVVWAAITLFD